jgi:tetratricopeptide (TPR) repeat protein
MPEPADAQRQAKNPAAVALQAKFNQGMSLHQQGKLADAERIYREVLRQEPQHFGALHLLGVIAIQTRQTQRGIELITKSIELNPDNAAAYSNLGSGLVYLKRFDEALEMYDKAIALKADYAEAYSDRGAALNHLKRYGEALASCDKAISLKPDDADAYYNKGIALSFLKRPEDALTSYDKAIALRPDFAEAHWNQSLYLLLLGRFEQGWRQYEWRKRRNEAVAVRTFPQPLWLGDEEIAGKTLFIWWEQGLGDTIQFCRYAKLAEARGAKVIMSVQQTLRGLLTQISPTIEIIADDKVPDNIDFHCPLLSMPLAFRTTLATIPEQKPYLKADKELRLAWAARLSPKTKPRIGVVWRGGTIHRKDHIRSMELGSVPR